MTTRPLPTKSIYHAHKDKGESHQRNSCGRKVKFATEKEAGHYGKGVYKCEYCSGWHQYTLKTIEEADEQIQKLLRLLAEFQAAQQLNKLKQLTEQNNALKDRVKRQAEHIRGLETKLTPLKEHNKQYKVLDRWNEWFAKNKKFQYEG